MVTRRKTAETPEPDPPQPDPPVPDGGEGGAGDGDPVDAKERRSIVQVVREEVQRLLGSGELVVEDDEKVDAPAAGVPAGPRQVEADTESAVRAALSKIHDEDVAKSAQEERLARIEAAIERPPAKLRRATRAMWGGE